MIIFNGKNIVDGAKATFAQHVSQMNVMFCAVKVEDGKNRDASGSPSTKCRIRWD